MNIVIQTSDDKWYDKEKFVIEFIKQMQNFNHVTVSVNSEGPSLVSNGIFELIDTICNKFGFNKKNVTIETSNQFETHLEYNIVINQMHWVEATVSEYLKSGFSISNFYNKKDIKKNVFGSFNNRPTWYRLSLLNCLNKSSVNSLVSCNSSWEEKSPNSILFDDIAFYNPSEFYEIVEYTKTCPKSLPIGPVTAEDKNMGFRHTLTSLNNYYNDFFIDVIGVTFTCGDTFYMDEKETRPMLCLTPFILYGTTGHLETLRGHGFKTFNQWWDESYDNYSGYERLKKMYQVINEISKTSTENLISMYNDMLPTLEYNYNYIMDFSLNYEKK